MFEEGKFVETGVYSRGLEDSSRSVDACAEGLNGFKVLGFGIRGAGLRFYSGFGLAPGGCGGGGVY